MKRRYPIMLLLLALILPSSSYSVRTGEKSQEADRLVGERERMQREFVPSATERAEDIRREELERADEVVIEVYDHSGIEGMAEPSGTRTMSRDEFHSRVRNGETIRVDDVDVSSDVRPPVEPLKQRQPKKNAPTKGKMIVVISVMSAVLLGFYLHVKKVEQRDSANADSRDHWGEG